MRDVNDFATLKPYTAIVAQAYDDIARIVGSLPAARRGWRYWTSAKRRWAGATSWRDLIAADLVKATIGTDRAALERLVEAGFE